MDETGLKAILHVELDTAQLDAQLAQIESRLSASGLNVGSGTRSGGGPATSNEVMDGAIKNASEQDKIMKATLPNVASTGTAQKMADNSDKQTDNSEKQLDTAKGLSNTLGAVNGVISTGFNAITGVMSMGFEFVEKMWKMIVEYSPGLKQILNLFDTAMQLFFAPIGTAIMMELMPLMVDLLENVMDVTDMMWDAFEKDGLAGMLAVAFERGLPLFFNFLKAAIEAIPENIPMLSSIKNLLTKILDFMDQHAINLLTSVMKITAFFVDNWPILLGMMGAMLGIQIAMLTVSLLDAMAPTVFGNKVPLGALGAAAAIPAITAAGGVMAGYAMMAEGGVVPATEGGQWKLLGEGGQDEFVVPRSKAVGFAESVLGGGGGTSFVNNGTIIGMDDLEQKVIGWINREMNAKRGRSGF